MYEKRVEKAENRRSCMIETSNVPSGVAADAQSLPDRAKGIQSLPDRESNPGLTGTPHARCRVSCVVVFRYFTSYC